MKYCSSGCGLMILLVATTAWAGEASIRETTLEIPTYAIGPEDRNPPLWNENVYPYPMQTDVGRKKQMATYRAVVLENDYLRVIVLPDVGGRIYAAHDKTNGDFDFIYRNHVIKPGLVALRGAWLSGGIEWNFPTRGHTVNTISPVPYKIVEGADGSVSCVVGTLEWVRRMKWTVSVTVFPDRSCLRNRILLENPTLTHNNAYFWANAAVHAWDDTKVSFSPTDYTYAGRRRNPQAWPIHGGRDLGWYRNTPKAFDYFSGTPSDFVAAYNHERGAGSVLFASRHDSFGKKFWTWGTARSGLIWEDILTDDDGQYIELQSGRLLTQGDSWLFEPHMQETWDEYWYPIKEMDGLVAANSDAAANLVVREGRLLVALNVTRALPDATVRVVAGDEEILRRTVGLSPGESWREEVPGSVDAEECLLTLVDGESREILRYRGTRAESPAPELEPEMPTGEDATAEELCLAGYDALKHWNANRADELFHRTLEKDPGFSPAHRWLSVLCYKNGRYEEALDHAGRALRRNEDDTMARYYRALSRIALGESERVEEDLDLIGRRAAFRHAAPYVQSSLAVAAGDLARAERLLRRAIHENRGDLKARTVLASVLRHAGRSDEARSLIDGVLEIDPVNCLASVEKALLDQANSGQLAVLRNDPQYYIEAACDYRQMNLQEDAAAALALYDNRPQAVPHPLICFYQGYLADRAGDRAQARRCYERGVELSPDYVFPSRRESLAVLETGLAYLPENWKIHYYQGTLLAARMRWQEGLEHLLAAARVKPPYAVLYRNLGEVFWHKLHDRAKAQAAYEQAFELDPHDATYYLALDQLYASQGLQEERAALFRRSPAGVRADFRVLLARAAYFTDLGRYDEALAILQKHEFHPWEGWTGARNLYVRALHLRADRAIEHGKYRAAIEDLELAMQWPENLGTGRPQNPDHSREQYKLGLCHRALGEPAAAERHFRRALENARSPDSPWRAKAEKELEAMKKS